MGWEGGALINSSEYVYCTSLWGFYHIWVPKCITSRKTLGIVVQLEEF